MKAPKLNQTTLYEILVKEVESLRKTNHAYNELLDKINKHLGRLEQLYEQPISVDIAAMQQEHARIQYTLHKWLYVPKWLTITFICLAIGFSLSLAFNCKQYIEGTHQHAYIEYADEHIQELKEQIAKTKSKR
ncbi:MAG: hypothetical protein ACYC2U_07370 [Candidatus Amoebophilus sp.]